MIAIFDEEYVINHGSPLDYSNFRALSSGGGTVDFQEFVGGLSAFSSRGGREEKLRCWSLAPCFCISSDDLFSVAFKVYDVDRDGFISNGELFLVLKMMVGNNLKVSPLARMSTSEALN